MTNLSNYSSKVNVNEPIHDEYPNLRELILRTTGALDKRQVLVDAWQFIYMFDEHHLYNLEQFCEFLLTYTRN